MPGRARLLRYPAIPPGRMAQKSLSHEDPVHDAMCHSGMREALLDDLTTDGDGGPIMNDRRRCASLVLREEAAKRGCCLKGPPPM